MAKKKTHPRDNEDAGGHWLFKMTFANAMDMVALFLSVQRSPTSRPPRDYLIFPFYPLFLFSFSPKIIFNVRASFVFFVLQIFEHGRLGRQHDSTGAVRWKHKRNNPRRIVGALLALSLSLPYPLSLSLPALSSPRTFCFSFSLYLHSIFSIQRTHLSRTATIVVLLFSDV